MIDAAEWQRNNEAYLAAAFNWLRLRLEMLAPLPSVIIQNAPQQIVSPLVEERRWGFFRQSQTAVEMPKPIAQIGTSLSESEILQAQIEEAAAALDEAAKAEPPPALVILSERLGLSSFERDVLLLCAALELDTRVAALCARAHDDAQKTNPTFALAMAMFDDPAWDALSPQRPLRYLHLIEINQPAAQPLMSSALRADERVLNFIKGLNEFDDRLAPLLTEVDVPDMDLPPSQQTIAEAILREIQYSAASISARRLPLIELTGIDSLSKQFVAAKIAGALGLQLYRLPTEVLPANAAELETLARLWQRELSLKPVALYLDARELNAETNSIASVQRFSAQCTGLTFLDTRSALSSIDDAVVIFDVASPTPVEQKKAWLAELSRTLNDAADTENVESESETGETNGISDAPNETGEIDFFAAMLAGQFNLSLPVIHRVGREAAALSSDKVQLRDAMWERCLSITRPRLDRLAQRIEPKATLGDIVLPDEASALLKQIVEQVRGRATVYDDWGFRERMNRGLGISVLFAGESGTGKTMAAEVIANELRLNLYRIDLSAVVSKYIGETEKNLRQVFDAAEEGGAILFFDEADALFGNRTKAETGNDRFANIEIGYLLQRLESYGGLAILTTNMKKALDSAFMRRFRFVVNFSFPGIAERARIWRNVFPPETPTDELDYQQLAERFDLSGGSINNIALNAAFLAANRNPPRVTMQLIFEAVKTELHKLNRQVSETKFALPRR
ncbi:MAG TPA: ATP-binding protein [Pyrinomonadaceae bacterium]|jgi:AAA+ superfamily predicted ATPase